MSSRVLLALLPVLVSGCSWFGGRAAGPAVPAAPSVALAPGPIDGFYRGSGQLASGSAASCPGYAWGALEIGDRTMLYSYTTDAIFVAPIAPSGQLHAESGGYVLDGTLSNGQLAFTVEGPSCKTAFAFHRLAEF